MVMSGLNDIWEVCDGYLLCALDFGWVVRVIGVDGEREQESTALVHACMMTQQYRMMER